jgi:hypothetical protein
MRRVMSLALVLAILAMAPSTGGSAAGQEGQRAKPRTSQPQPRQAVPRRAAPQRVLPPRYHVLPRPYYFMPIGTQRGFYYHPYFGFYFGPYYGPFYPYPGPYFGSDRYSASSLRTKVKPEETMVYVNGYYAGEADDFDGIFQGLYLPSGEHDIEFFLEGYRTFGEHLYLNSGASREIVHQMQRLGPGETSAPPLPPRGRAEKPAPYGMTGDRPASPYGILVISVEPVDAVIVVDGEDTPGTGSDVAVHLVAGWHDLEIRREGYATFKTRIELSEGGTTRLNVRLMR